MAAAKRQLRAAVFVHDPLTGESTCYQPGDTVPAEVAKRLGEHVWATDEDSGGDEDKMSESSSSRK